MGEEVNLSESVLFSILGFSIASCFFPHNILEMMQEKGSTVCIARLRG